MTRIAFALLLVAAPLSAQATSESRIPVRKQKQSLRVDTVRIHDTVTLVRVDTVVRIISTDFQTLRIERMTDTLDNGGGFIVPFIAGAASGVLGSALVHSGRECPDIPVPPFVVPAGPIGPTMTPEPATWLMTATGLVGLAIVATRRRK